MTISFKCISCNKNFYVFGASEKALHDLVDAAIVLRSEGYGNLKVGAWRVVEGRAKCCHKPNIVATNWGGY